MAACRWGILLICAVATACGPFLERQPAHAPNEARLRQRVDRFFADWYGRIDFDALLRLSTRAIRQKYEGAYPAEMAAMRSMAKEMARGARVTARIVGLSVRGLEACVKEEMTLVTAAGERKTSLAYARWRFEDDDWYIDGLAWDEHLPGHCSL